MQYQRYETSKSFSTSSSEYDKSDEELYYEKYNRQSMFNGRETTGSKLFRRWFLNIIDFPNALTNRLKNWLNASPASRSSTTDKSSGTNSSVNPSEIRLPKYIESDDDYSEKYKHKRNRDDPTKNHAPGAHRPLQNYHVYHIYKQNEMEIHRSAGGQRNYSTSWLQRNERVSSSPVLLLPRINPTTGQPIFHPRSYHSRTSTERRTVIRGDKNSKRENWRSGIWKLETNNYTHLRGDTNLIEAFVEKQITEKSLSSLKSKMNRVDKNNSNDDGELDLKSVELNVTGSTAFRETLSMRFDQEDSQSFAGTPYNEIIDKNNSSEIRVVDAKEPTSTEKVYRHRELSTITPNNVEDLLKNLREKINSLNAEKKFTNPVGRLSSLMKQERGSYNYEHSLPSRWHDKSSIFVKNVKPISPETRASFTERIQDIWIQEKMSSQWAIHKRPAIFRDESTKIQDNECIEEEQEICHNIDTNMKIEKKDNFQSSKKVYSIETQTNDKQDDETLTSFLSSSNDNEISEPIVCNVAVQYSATEVETSNELHNPLVSPSGNNDDKSEIQIPENIKSLTVPNKILMDSIQIPPTLEIQAYAQYFTEASGDYVSPLPFIGLESRDCEDKDYFIDELSTKDTSQENTLKSLRPFIQFPHNKKLRYRFTRLSKISHKPFIRFSRNSLIKVKKLRLSRYRIYEKIRLWLVDKFQSDNEAVGDKRKSDSRESVKIGCMTNIFECMKKTSKMDVSSNIVDSSPIIKPIPPIRLKKLRAQNLTDEVLKPISTNEENSLITKSMIKCPEKMELDLSTIDSEASGNCKTHSKRSMTMLSVTTSNSTNITLQLLDSTSDTTIVPSRSLQDDFNRQVVEAPDCTEITMRKQEIETSEENDDCRTDLLSPVPIVQNEESKTFEFNDILEITEISKSSNKDISEKILKFDKKIPRADVTNKYLRTKENRLLIDKKRDQVKSDETVSDKKISLDIEKLPTRKKINRNGKIQFSDNADAQNENKLRLKYRKSVMDIGIDIASESSTKIAYTRNLNNQLKGRKVNLNSSENVYPSKTTTKECPEKQQIQGYNSKRFYPELSPGKQRKKLRQRSDSPMIPRNTTNTLKRCTAAGKTSLIPVGIGNLRYIDTASKSDENKPIFKSKLREEKNLSVLKTNSKTQKYRTSLKKPSDDLFSKGKKTANHRVRFELEKIPPNEEAKKTEDEFAVFSEKLIDRSSSSIDHKIDDELLVRKIVSSLENGMPLKRITIMDPYSVPKSRNVKYDCNAKSKVEKSVIDHKRELSANTQNLTTLMKKTRPISSADKELVDQAYPHRKTPLSKQASKHEDSFEKRYPYKAKLSYRSRASREKNKNHSTNSSSERESKNFNESIVDFTRIKEQVDNEILEKTSRTSGTEDSDCANVLIKAINSSMEMSDDL